jgi:hypothetical protein
MSVPAIRAAAEALRQLQQRASAATAARADGWRHDVVQTRREIAMAIGDLVAMTRGWTPPTEAEPAHAAFRRSVDDVRRALAMHQALWPAVSIDSAQPAFQASVGELRGAYQTLFVRLDELERATKTIGIRENSV